MAPNQANQVPQTTDNEITLNDGRIVPSARCLQDENRLFVYVDNMGIKEGFDMFWQNTETICFRSFGNETVYSGYSELYSVSEQRGVCNIALKKGWS